MQAKFGDKLYAVHEQALKKILADIPFVSEVYCLFLSRQKKDCLFANLETLY